ncbi:L,D-transpeptidase [Streptomyces fructofermentans]|uniref:L,D-TPase catalytic domain-containing protein n=1 Tax=Streptomyces fructofermentans TaxID=152141 RepID=A0A918KUT3_9ACTN|nr:L,D-transpeptidase [Streptomyces fructofermentans]GGX77433.1 hypothetical protein GCM10010515_51630 [Streptomyces fructofermentans]
MSGEPTPGLPRESSDAGLTAALRELAQEHETPVPVPGAEIRRRAVRRRGRRQLSLAAAGATAAGALALVLAVVLDGGEETGSVPPAASHGVSTPAPTTPAADGPSAVAAVTVDLARRELTFDGRSLPISSGGYKTPTPTGAMTVTAKAESSPLPGGAVGIEGGYDVKGSWVMELRTPDDRSTYLVALTWDEKAPGNYDHTGGVIGLRSGDAMWLYKQLRLGAVVDVVGTAPPEPTGTAGSGEPPTATGSGGADATGP